MNSKRPMGSGARIVRDQPRGERKDDTESDLPWEERRAFRQWLLARIDEAASLPAPHLFQQPREFFGRGRFAARVGGLAEAVEELCRLVRSGDGSGEEAFLAAGSIPNLFCRERICAEKIVEGLVRASVERSRSPVLRSYRYPSGWQNRLILGDSLLVLRSLLLREGRRGEVQAIYFDPPYGVNFPSHFHPFARGRNDEEEQPPARVRAYRDSWEFGLPSYLAYLRERLILCQELLHRSGSLFLQIGEENLHHVRTLLDEVFGERNFVSLISFRKTSALPGKLLRGVSDYLLWYAKEKEQVKYRALYRRKRPGTEGATNYRWVELPDGSCRKLSAAEQANPGLLPPGSKIFALGDLRSAGASARGSFAFSFGGKLFRPYANSHWKTTREGMERLARMGRLVVSGRTLMYKRYLSDFPVVGLTNHWADVRPSFQRNRRYVVETVERVVERCLLMTTDPGDLVLDPTCGSGTTGVVAERWGRRWICIDAARLPLALTRMRLLTSIFPYYVLRDSKQGPAGGFLYARRQNGKGEEVGGIVPHLTLEAIAKERPAVEELLVDCPEEAEREIRLSGPFSVEGLFPGEAGKAKRVVPQSPSFRKRMGEVLRLSPVFEASGRRRLRLQRIRELEHPLLCAEGELAGKRVAISFGPEDEPIGEGLVRSAAGEAKSMGYEDVYIIGFALDPAALERLREKRRGGTRLFYVEASLDLFMGSLLKSTPSSQIFSLVGIPEVRLRKGAEGTTEMWVVELGGMTVFHPVEGTEELQKPEELPAWFLDTDYDGCCFTPSVAFFPRTKGWEEVGRALEEGAAERIGRPLAGGASFPFPPGRHRRIAVKTIDDRGTELLVVRELPSGRPNRGSAPQESDVEEKAEIGSAWRGQKPSDGI
ncbi:DNA methyltransferase [Methylacidimicrobium cyclopophantes]|nr:site-specific DNA-methyltransferase [Methylacidimicrobium cyclopophantes]